jgi:hypothetical protein
MNSKKCPFCSHHECIRKGKQDGHQRWQCKDCNKKFQANKKVLPSKEELFCLYAFNKQTLKELSQEYHEKREVFQTLFDDIVFKPKRHDPREIALCVDTTFFGDFGVVVFRDEREKENLWWKFVQEEKGEYYQEGKNYLEQKGYVLASVTADGLPGLPHIFQGIPFQFCHFHARKNITKYITRKPKTEAGKELQCIMYDLKHSTHDTFVSTITNWNTKHQGFLKEKTTHPDGSWSYTHRKLRSAIRSMMYMSSYLFTYQTRRDIYIPSTTNTLEGHFSHIKVRVGCHRSISIRRKQKIIHAILLASSAEYKKDLYTRVC